MDEQHGVHVEGDPLGLPFPAYPHECAGRGGDPASGTGGGVPDRGTRSGVPPLVPNRGSVVGTRGRGASHPRSRTVWHAVPWPSGAGSDRMREAMHGRPAGRGGQAPRPYRNPMPRDMVPMPSQWNVSAHVIGGRWTRSVATLKLPGSAVIASSCLATPAPSARCCVCRTDVRLTVTVNTSTIYLEVL